MSADGKKREAGIVGITGGIGSGKSTVGSILSDMGRHVIDVDNIARELTSAGSPMLKVVAENFGNDVITESGELDRSKLSEIVFYDEGERKRLESILHPAINRKWKKRAEEYVDKTGDWCFVLIPLLFEAGNTNDFDVIWLCYAPEEIRLSRTIERDESSHDQIIARMRAQMPDELKMEKSDFIIDTSSTMEDLEMQVKRALEGIGVSVD